MGTSDKRNRTKYTPDQLAELERVFSQSQYPDTLTMEELADKLNVTIEKISIWFQNRRSKFKRQSKDTHMSWMRKQIFNRENVPQPCIPKSDDKRHVLSAPDRNYHRYESPADKPSSNLHYLPPLPSYMDSVLDLSVLPSQTNSCGQPSPPGYVDSQQDQLRFHPSFPAKSLFISHLMAEQQTGSTPAQPTIFPAPQFSSCMYNSSFPGMYYYPPNFNASQMVNMVPTQSTVM